MKPEANISITPRAEHAVEIIALLKTIWNMYWLFYSIKRCLRITEQR